MRSHMRQRHTAGAGASITTHRSEGSTGILCQVETLCWWHWGWNSGDKKTFCPPTFQCYGNPIIQSWAGFVDTTGGQTDGRRETGALLMIILLILDTDRQPGNNMAGVHLSICLSHTQKRSVFFQLSLCLRSSSQRSLLLESAPCCP